jgi:hypothetical protein
MWQRSLGTRSVLAPSARRPILGCMRLPIAILLLGLVASPLAGQTVLERIRVQRDSGDLAGAAAALELHLASNPRDAPARALLAETRYWLRDFEAAIAAYELALALDPSNDAIRLDFGRTLVELQDSKAAIEVLGPLASRADAAGIEALFLLATLDYRSGERSRARAQFEMVLGIVPDHAGALRSLAEIRQATAPWLRIEPQYERDTQTVTRAGATVEAGVFLTPLVILDLRSSVIRSGWSDSTTNIAGADVGVRARMAGARTTLEAAIGAAHWSLAGETRVVGRIGAAVDLAAHLTLAASAARAPYTNTTASLSAPLAPHRYQLRLTLDRPDSWTGEVAGRTEQFPDDNRVVAGWAWLLAPIITGSAGHLRLGWHAGYQDARESRFEPVPAGVLPDGTRRFTGRYVPYYSPARIVTHGPAGALTVRPSTAVTVSANGSWGLHAAEDAPFYFAADTLPDAQPVRGVHRRTFHPVEARAALNLAGSARTSLTFEAHHIRTAFYDATRVLAGIVIVFAPRGR